MGSLCVYLLMLASEGLEKKRTHTLIPHWMQFLRDSLLGELLFDKAKTGQNPTWFLCLNHNFFCCLSLSGINKEGLMTIPFISLSTLFHCFTDIIMITKKRVRSTNCLSVNVQYSTSELTSQHTCFQPSYVFAA